MFFNCKKSFWKRKVRGTIRLGKSSFSKVDKKVDKVERMAFYGKASSIEELLGLVSWVEKLTVSVPEVSLLVYLPRMKHASEQFSGLRERNSRIEVIPMLDQDLDFSLFPSGRYKAGVGHFFSTRFDLFVDLSPDFHYVDVSVSVSVTASLKLGKPGFWNSQVNHCSLKVNDGQDYTAVFLDTLEKYLPVLGIRF